MGTSGWSEAQAASGDLVLGLKWGWSPGTKPLTCGDCLHCRWPVSSAAEWLDLSSAVGELVGAEGNTPEALSWKLWKS